MATLSTHSNEAVAPVPGMESHQQGEAVAEFCRSKGLEDQLSQAIQFAGEAFSPVEAIELELRRNPEAEDAWVVLRVRVRADRVNVPTARKEFTAKWVAFAPPESRFLIRLSPDII